MIRSKTHIGKFSKSIGREPAADSANVSVGQIILRF